MTCKACLQNRCCPGPENVECGDDNIARFHGFTSPIRYRPTAEETARWKAVVDGLLKPPKINQGGD
jgi:hypothetical protein